MSNFKDIATRHLKDRWKDALFIGAAVLLTALAIGSVTSKGVGKTTPHEWGVSMVDGTQDLPK
jgi:hypothetical protein